MLNHVCVFLKARYGIRLTWSFFGSHHGKNACDTRKKRIKMEGLASGGVIVGASEMAEIMSDMKSVGRVVALPYMVRPEGWEVSLLTKCVMRGCHFFEYLGPVVVTDRERTIFGSRLFGAQPGDSDACEIKISVSFDLDLGRTVADALTERKVNKKGEFVNSGVHAAKRKAAYESMMTIGTQVQVAHHEAGRKK